MMETLEYTVRFTTPAFLGNAEQSGQWRTPPFKALLRQWWRVVWAADNGFGEDIARMRADEARLLGSAADKAGEAVNRRSLVRLRLDKWDRGAETRQQWGGKDLGRKIRHPEVPQPVGPLLYLGYGPLETPRGEQGRRRGFPTTLKPDAAIQAGESAKLSIAAPEGEMHRIRTAVALMHAYGTIGGRSRNGWGSFCLTPLEDTPPPSADLTRFFRPWRDALTLDWPHAIGKDQRPLIWRTTELFEDWEQALRALAIVKIGLRTLFRFPPASPPHPRPLERHWLSYPITKHKVKGWGNSKLLNSRLPNSLRFKVRPDPDDGTKLCGVIFHVPCLPPPQFHPDRRAIEGVWQTVHDSLDRAGFTEVGLTRTGA